MHEKVGREALKLVRPVMGKTFYFYVLYLKIYFASLRGGQTAVDAVHCGHSDAPCGTTSAGWVKDPRST